MFAAHYDDGRVAYFVIEGRTALDMIPGPIALERQRTGELPQGVIKVVKQVR